MVPKVKQWLKVDFYLLHEPQYSYKQQERINTQRVDVASTVMIHVGLDLGEFEHFLGEEESTRGTFEMSREL